MVLLRWVVIYTEISTTCNAHQNCSPEWREAMHWGFYIKGIRGIIRVFECCPICTCIKFFIIYTSFGHIEPLNVVGDELVADVLPEHRPVVGLSSWALHNHRLLNPEFSVFKVILECWAGSMLGWFNVGLVLCHMKSKKSSSPEGWFVLTSLGDEASMIGRKLLYGRASHAVGLQCWWIKLKSNSI